LLSNVISEDADNQLDQVPEKDINISQSSKSLSDGRMMSQEMVEMKDAQVGSPTVRSQDHDHNKPACISPNKQKQVLSKDVIIT